MFSYKHRPGVLTVKRSHSVRRAQDSERKRGCERENIQLGIHRSTRKSYMKIQRVRVKALVAPVK